MDIGPLRIKQHHKIQYITDAARRTDRDRGRIDGGDGIGPAICKDDRVHLLGHRSREREGRGGILRGRLLGEQAIGAGAAVGLIGDRRPAFERERGRTAQAKPCTEQRVASLDDWRGDSQ